MADPVRRFEVVGDDEPDQSSPPRNDAATNLMLMALGALSKRAIIALESLFTLITAGFVFWATLGVLPEPTTHQLIGLGIFSVFVLIANWLVLNRRGR